MSVLTPAPSTAARPARVDAASAEGGRKSSARLWLALGYTLGPVAIVTLAALGAGFSAAEAVRLPVAWGVWLVITGVLLWGLRDRHRHRPLARHLARLLGALLAGLLVLGAAAAWGEAPGGVALNLLAALPAMALVCATVPWQRRARRLRFALLGGGVADELQGLATATWLPLRLDEGEALPARTDALVADLHAQHTTAVLNAMATHALRGLPILNAAAAHELLTERVALRLVSEESIQEFHRPIAYDALKRLFDVFCVLASLPLVLPLMAVVAVVVRLESPGPILFRQRRVGHLGRPFTMYKFRSMDHRIDPLEPQFTSAEDARVTRVGRFIRKFRVDELPQFWNVLRGDMSIIGPRPEQVPFVETFEEVIPLYPYRHTVRPGITGWSQVKLGYAASAHEAVEKLEYDLYYVKHLSFSLDLLILFKTVRTIVTGYGAR